MSRKSSFYLRTPGNVDYPLTTEDVLVEPGQVVKKGETIATLRTARGTIIGLKSPRDARIGDHIMPSGTPLLEQSFFVQMHEIGAGKEAEKASETVNGSTQTPDPPPDANSDAPATGRMADAALAFLLPVFCMLPAVILGELVFPDFFEDFIWVRWLMIIAGVLAGIFWASAKSSTPPGTSNALATVATVSACVIAIPLMFPLDLFETEMAGLSGFSFGDLFKTKVAGVPIDDLTAYSNGNTPSPSPDLVRDFDRWLND